MYRYIIEDFHMMMLITRHLLVNNYGFKCWQETNDTTWIIELTGEH